MTAYVTTCAAGVIVALVFASWLLDALAGVLP